MSAAHRVAIICVALTAFPVAAYAQGFLEGLFGFGGAQWSQPSTRQAASHGDFRYREPVTRPSSSYRREGTAPTSVGKYRTVCVRMCDGYYFPISGSVSERVFYRDAQICRRSCGSEAKLFYHDTSSGDAREMIDLTGRSYPSLANAFRYRKQIVDGCTCRPEPWSAAEVARHQRYAAESAQKHQTTNDPAVVATEPDRIAANVPGSAVDPEVASDPEKSAA